MKNRLFIHVLFFISLKASACGATPEVFNTINQRLSFMNDVALYKAHHQLPIENSARELVVINKAILAASQQGLDPHSVEGFFKAQITVAKIIQYRHRASLLAGGLLPQGKDLQTEVRPALLELGDKIIIQLAEQLKKHGPVKRHQLALFNTAINIEHITEDDKRLLFNALIQVALLPTH